MHCRQLEFTTQEIKFIFLKASIPLCFIIPVWFREIVFFWPCEELATYSGVYPASPICS